ncbi:uncharacterized protein LOC112493736 [Cephus cinctus]|uniref:Uncharacterized protein LOC112493736 n=1 Tax=Cephus cinctus TaxID=211228 RepID=A0AAJ7R9F2_CEPCN|nr:uncharacterized protein LOC112493736 [Cephus cinctus]
MDFSKINKVAHLEGFLPTKKLSELEVEKEYKITSIRTIQTKFGARHIVDVENSFSVFLPARISRVLTDGEDFFQRMVLDTAENQLCMRYLGGKFNLMEFRYL